MSIFEEDSNYIIMMRQIVVIILCFAISTSLWAQSHNDGFGSYDEMVGKEVVMYGLEDMYKQSGAFAYSKVNGKYKVIKEKYYYQNLDGRTLTIKSIDRVKDKAYIEVESGKSTAYYLVNNKFDYLKRTRSKTFWDNTIDKYNNQLSFVRYPSILIETISDATLARHLGKYVPVKWESAQLPTNVDGEVMLVCSIDNVTRVLSESNIQQLIQEFISTDEYRAEEKAYQEQLSIVRAHRDSTLLLEASVLHSKDVVSYLESNGITYYEEDTLWFSIYGSHYEDIKDRRSNKNKEHYYDGFLLWKDIRLRADDLVFQSDPISEEAREHIDQRGNKTVGLTIRKENASKNDSIRSAYQLNKAKTRLEKLQNTLSKINNLRKQKKIVILEQGYSYSDYQFGLRFKFFNCYNKEIKYIEIKANAYNQVGDLQNDYFGHSSQSARCIGPIGKEEEAEYEFDKMFWDEFDVIHHLTVVDVKITFMDGSVVRYSGKDNVRQHTADYYSNEQKKILMESGLNL